MSDHDAKRLDGWSRVLRLVRLAATGLAVALALAWGVLWLSASRPPALGSRVATAFTLQDTQGRPVTEATFRGKWQLVYFGYTYCPDICPTELQTISGVLDRIGTDAAQLVPVFITVDPQRDTPVALGQYLGLFDSRLVGLTGGEQQLAAIEKAYGVVARRVESAGSDGYLIDHTSYVYLIDGSGQLRSLYQPNTSEADMADSIVAEMSGRG